jgi:hypothetical protein
VGFWLALLFSFFFPYRGKEQMGEEGISICRVRFWWCLCYEVKVKGTAQHIDEGLLLLLL